MQVDSTLGIIAGNRKFPLIFADAARKRGVKKLVAVAFEGETDPALAEHVDAIEWVRLGKLNDLVKSFQRHEVRDVVMVGQIAPKNLFSRVSLDLRMTMLLAKLHRKNAETIFGAIGEELSKDGLRLVPHLDFLEDLIPKAGALTRKAPSREQRQDIDFGVKIAKQVSAIDIGQTVVVKEGVVLAVEAFEGTDSALRRGGELGQGGAVAVKVSKPGQDLRFDVPVLGVSSVETASKAGIAVLAIEAGRSLLLERDATIERADQLGVCLFAFEGSS
ncbi:MAG: UDP-2,3-diacylglucosamine diphosphatase LpxI [Verrucomicrobiae bacterium]|nr:UDP-2,3-diacylglucosamine diphosphatase LpxI [Verrucomicrobiae bacterium]